MQKIKFGHESNNPGGLAAMTASLMLVAIEHLNENGIREEKMPVVLDCINSAYMVALKCVAMSESKPEAANLVMAAFTSSLKALKAAYPDYDPVFAGVGVQEKDGTVIINGEEQPKAKPQRRQMPETN